MAGNFAMMPLTPLKSISDEPEAFIFRTCKGISLRHIMGMIIVSIISCCMAEFANTLVVHTKISFETELWSSFFQCSSTIYAIIAGFVLVNTLNRFKDLKQCFFSELNSIQAMRDSLTLMAYNVNTQEIKKFKISLLNYLNALNDEWGKLSQHIQFSKELDSDTNPQLNNIYCGINTLYQSRTDKTESFGFDVLTNNLDILAKARTNRILLSKRQLPHELLFLITWMTIILVIGFVMRHQSRVYINYYIIIGFSTSVYWLFAVLLDLDHPFYGVWFIDPEPLYKLIKKFEKDIKYSGKNIRQLDVSFENEDFYI